MSFLSLLRALVLPFLFNTWGTKTKEISCQQMSLHLLALSLWIMVLSKKSKLVTPPESWQLSARLSTPPVSPAPLALWNYRTRTFSNGTKSKTPTYSYHILITNSSQVFLIAGLIVSCATTPSFLLGALLATAPSLTSACPLWTGRGTPNASSVKNAPGHSARMVTTKR